MIRSDWHIHSEYSHDSNLAIETIVTEGQKQGLRFMGVTDHVNFNDERYLGNLRRSAEGVKAAQKEHPFLVLGVELTPIEKPEFDHISKTGTREGYVPPVQSHPYDIELAVSKDELEALGVRYVIGASHWRVDLPYAKTLTPVIDEHIREWYRQQMYLACDERVTILGHPWWHGKGLWYEDFAIIPRSMNEDIAAALKENGKYAECNSCFFCSDSTSEKFKHQYAEFLREMFEAGIPIVYGSDAHNTYTDVRSQVEKYLSDVGFACGDISELSADIIG